MKTLGLLMLFCLIHIGLSADSGVIDPNREFQSIKQQTLIDGRQTYPHGFYTNERLKTQLQINNSALNDNIGGTGIRYQIKNPSKINKSKPNLNKKPIVKKKNTGFSFSQMAKELQTKPAPKNSKRGFSFSQMASQLKAES